MPEPKRMYELKQMHKDAGGSFFGPAEMRGFRSIVYDNVYVGVDGWYFVTSEQFEDSRGNRDPRHYNVRFMPEDNHRYIRTVRGFGRMATKEEALSAARALARGELVPERAAWE